MAEILSPHLLLRHIGSTIQKYKFLYPNATYSGLSESAKYGIVYLPQPADNLIVEAYTDVDELILSGCALKLYVAGKNSKGRTVYRSILVAQDLLSVFEADIGTGLIIGGVTCTRLHTKRRARYE